MSWGRTLSHSPHRLLAAAALGALLAAGCADDGRDLGITGVSSPDVTTSTAAAAAGGDGGAAAATDATTTAAGAQSSEADPGGDTDEPGGGDADETSGNGDSDSGNDPDGSDSDGDGGESDGSGDGGESDEPLVEPLSEEDDPQPLRADSAGSAAFLGEVILWMFNEDEPDAPSLTDCISAAFVDSFDEQRLDELAEVADDLNLWSGLGADFLLDEEMAAFVAQTETCTNFIFGDGDISGTLFGNQMGVPTEPSAEYQQAALECTRRIVSDGEMREAILTVALFDPSAESDLRIFDLLTERCGETLMLRLMSESAAEGMDLDYEMALCSTKAVYNSLVESMADDTMTADEIYVTMQQVRFGSLTDCGVPVDKVLEIYGIPDEPPPDEAGSEEPGRSEEPDPADQP